MSHETLDLFLALILALVQLYAQIRLERHKRTIRVLRGELAELRQDYTDCVAMIRRLSER